MTWAIIGITTAVFVWEFSAHPQHLEDILYLFGILPARYGSHPDWALRVGSLSTAIIGYSSRAEDCRGRSMKSAATEPTRVDGANFRSSWTMAGSARHSRIACSPGTPKTFLGVPAFISSQRLYTISPREALSNLVL